MNLNEDKFFKDNGSNFSLSLDNESFRKDIETNHQNNN